jgi:hypothetical protein
VSAESREKGVAQSLGFEKRKKTIDHLPNTRIADSNGSYVSS